MTRADQWGAFWRGCVAIATIAAITAAASIDALRIGPAAAGLLYLLPVLWASARAGLNAGLASAAAAAFCYNFFLLEPRYTLRIHGVGDVAAFVVLTVVAVVTSRLAADLRAKEADASRRAAASEAEATFATRLARAHDRAELDTAAIAFVGEQVGDARLFRAGDIASDAGELSPLDAAAAAWALNNWTPSGRGTEVMPAADYLFASFGPESDDVLAIAPRDHGEGDRREMVAALARVWRQARDRLATDDERQARQAAEERERLRRTLLAALGHDFRTPLTVLKSGLAELPGEAAARLLPQVERLVRLTDDLLAAARLEGDRVVAVEAVDLVDVIAAALPPPDGAAVDVAVELPDDLPLVRAEPVMVVHVLTNLIDNARRHAHQAVRVTASAAGERVFVDVRDDGDGIDPALRDMVFERFVAGPDRGSHSGLGLAIARDLARAMAGELTAPATVEGDGACFRLKLPVAHVRAAQP